MTQFRSNPALSSSEAPTGLFSRWVCFWFRPADPLALHLIRLLAGLLFLSWLLPFAGQIQAFFSLDGWLDRRALSELVRLPEDLAPQLSWSLLYLCGSNVTLLTVMYWVSIAILVLFTLGVWPRVLAVLTWLIVVSFTANPAISFDAETLLIVLAFYLMVGYLLDGLPSSLRSPGRLRALAGPLLVWPLRRPGATPAARECGRQPDAAPDAGPFRHCHGRHGPGQTSVRRLVGRRSLLAFRLFSIRNHPREDA